MGWQCGVRICFGGSKRLFAYTSVDQKVENKIRVKSPAGHNIQGLIFSNLFISATPHLLKTQQPCQIIPLTVNQVYKHIQLSEAC